MKIEEEALDVDKIRKKRFSLLLGMWDYFVKIGIFREQNLKLSLPIANEVIEHYCIDYKAIKARYNIPGRISREKIAGLMVALIMRYKPILLLADQDFDDEELNANELLSLMYGLSVCFEDTTIPPMSIAQEFWFREWSEDFTYLLHARHYTAESLAFIFKTLKIFVIKEHGR